MKRTVLLFLFIQFLNSIISSTVSAQTLIHYWNFNTFSGTMPTPAIKAIPADYTVLPGSNARVLYTMQPGTSAGYFSLLESFTSNAEDYDTVNLRMDSDAGTYIRTKNPSDSMELLLYTPSTHFRNVVLTFGTCGSNHGMKYQHYDYSIDSGATWTTTGLSMLTDSVRSTFRRITLTCSNTTVNNNPKLVFRIRWTGNNTGTRGNNRFDNISLEGDSLSAEGLKGK